MKTKLIILVTICAYIGAMIYSWQNAENSVNRAVYEEMHSIDRDITKILGWSEEHYDAKYVHREVKYSKTIIPQRPQKPSTKDKSDFMKQIELEKYQEDVKEWKEKYGDLLGLYALEYESNVIYEAKNGWKLVGIDYEGCIPNRDNKWQPILSVRYIFPYAVGYRPESTYYRPSIQTIVQEAYDFWTKDSKSSYADRFKYGFYNDCMYEITNISAESRYFKYNNWDPYTDRKTSYQKERTFFDKPLQSKLEEFDDYDHIPLDGGYMYNNFYRVFNAFTRPVYYAFERQDDVIEEDIKSLRIKWIVCLTILLLLITIPLMVISRRKRKLMNETYYDKLKRLCNPSNFLKNYDKAKVDVANEIYQKLLQTSPDDKETLDKIQADAIDKLKISLIDKSLLDDLKKKVNPQFFMKKYDAEKVLLANDLYARLQNDNLSYNEFIEIQELAKQL